MAESIPPGFYWAVLPTDQWVAVSRTNGNWHPPMLRVRATNGRTADVLEPGNFIATEQKQTWGVVEVLRPMAATHWPYPEFGPLGKALTTAEIQKLTPQQTAGWEQPDPSLTHVLSEAAEDISDTAEDVGKAASKLAMRAAMPIATMLGVLAAVGLGVWIYNRTDTKRGNGYG